MEHASADCVSSAMISDKQNEEDDGYADSGAGRKLKVGGGGITRPARIAGKKILSCPSTFFGPKSTISRFDERFYEVSTVCQFLDCCSSTHGAPRAQPFVKVGGTCHIESAPVYADSIVPLCFLP